MLALAVDRVDATTRAVHLAFNPGMRWLYLAAVANCNRTNGELLSASQTIRVHLDPAANGKAQKC